MVRVNYAISRNGRKSHRVEKKDKSLPPWLQLPARDFIVRQDEIFRPGHVVWINTEEDEGCVDYLALIDQIRVLPDGQVCIKIFWFDEVVSIQLQNSRGLPEGIEATHILLSWSEICMLDAINAHATREEIEASSTDLIALYSLGRDGKAVWTVKDSKDPAVSWVLASPSVTIMTNTELGHPLKIEPSASPIDSLIEVKQASRSPSPTANIATSLRPSVYDLPASSPAKKRRRPAALLSASTESSPKKRRKTTSPTLLQGQQTRTRIEIRDLIDDNEGKT